MHTQFSRVILNGVTLYLGVPKRFPAPSSSVAEQWNRCTMLGWGG